MRSFLTALLLTCCSLLAGCAVVAVASTAASIAATGAGLAVDAAVGTVRITGRAIGAAADVVLPSGER